MERHDRIEIVLTECHRGIAELTAAATAQLRAILDSPDAVPRDPWLVLKDAARKVGKSDKVVWAMAQRAHGASWMHGRRRMVNLDRLPIDQPPVA